MSAPGSSIPVPPPLPMPTVPPPMPSVGLKRAAPDAPAVRYTQTTLDTALAVVETQETRNAIIKAVDTFILNIWDVHIEHVHIEHPNEMTDYEVKMRDLHTSHWITLSVSVNQCEVCRSEVMQTMLWICVEKTMLMQSVNASTRDPCNNERAYDQHQENLRYGSRVTMNERMINTKRI
jgi:hypothetical protein